LIQAGLTEEEVLIYLDLLNKPASTKWEITIRTGFEKNRVYRAFDKLESLKMVAMNRKNIHALPLHGLIDKLLENQKSTFVLAQKLKQYANFCKIPTEELQEFETATTKEEILNQYIKMSEIKYNTCLDFGDLEGLVPILGGLDPVFKFRVNRFKQNAKNKAICTTTGPFTSCMARKSDMQRFKSNIETLKINFKNKWIIFSDSTDYIMFNNFEDPQNPTSTLIKSKLVADTQRLQFDQFYENMKKF